MKGKAGGCNLNTCNFSKEPHSTEFFLDIFQYFQNNFEMPATPEKYM